MSSFRSLFYTLHKIGTPQNFKLRLLADYAEQVNEKGTFPFGPVIDFCIEAHGKQDSYPKPSTINKKFADLFDPELSEIDDIDDPIVWLDEIFQTLEVQTFRMKVMSGSVENDIVKAVSAVRDVVVEFGKSYVEEVVGSIDPMSIEDIYNEISERKPGMKTYVAELDEAIHRIGFGRVFTIGAFAGHFKTSFALNLAEQNVMDGFNIAFISLEMTKNEIYQKFLSRHTASLISVPEPVAFTDIQSANLTKDQIRWLIDAEQNIKSAPGMLLIYDSADLMSYGPDFIQNIESICHKAEQELDGQLHAVVFDHLQIAKFHMPKARDPYEAGNAVMGKIRDLSLAFKKEGLIWIVLSQFNRDSYAKALRLEGRYTLASFAEINEIERASYYALALFLTETLKENRTIKYQLLKHRGGPVLEEPRETECDPASGTVGSRRSVELFGLDTIGELRDAVDAGDLDLDDFEETGGVFDVE